MTRIERLNALLVEYLLVSGRRDRAVAWKPRPNDGANARRWIEQTRLPAWAVQPADPPTREELRVAIARLRFMLEAAS